MTNTQILVIVLVLVALWFYFQSQKKEHYLLDSDSSSSQGDYFSDEEVNKKIEIISDYDLVYPEKKKKKQWERTEKKERMRVLPSF